MQLENCVKIKVFSIPLKFKMTPNPRFASGGDCLKIWDGSNSVFEYRPKLSRKIEGISWSNDGLCIAR